MKTKEQFLDAYRHELAGVVLDACTASRHGGELALFVRTVLRRIDALLARAYEEFQPPKTAPTNGAPAKGAVK